MSYRVAICDDEVYTCSQLEEMTEKCFSRLALRVTTDVFYSGESLINYINQNNEYDFILLDIELYELNGVELGKIIRDINHDMRTQIIYISSKTMYAMELFQVQPLDFLVKPVDEEMLKKDFMRGISILGKLHEEFECHTGRKTVYIPYNRIIYFTIKGRQIDVVTTDGTTSFYGKLGEIISSLPECFIQVHKSYIVNINMITQCTYDVLHMAGGENVMIGRTYREEVKRKIFDRRME